MRRTVSIADYTNYYGDEIEDEIAQLEKEFATLLGIEEETERITGFMSLIKRAYKVIIVIAIAIALISASPNLTRVIFDRGETPSPFIMDSVKYDFNANKWYVDILLESADPNRVSVSYPFKIIPEDADTTTLRVYFNDYYMIPDVLTINYGHEKLYVSIPKVSGKVYNLNVSSVDDYVLVKFLSNTKLVGLKLNGAKLISMLETRVDDSVEYSLKIIPESNYIVLSAVNVNAPITISLENVSAGERQVAINITATSISVASLRTRSIPILVNTSGPETIKITATSSTGATAISCPFMVSVNGQKVVYCNITGLYTKEVAEDMITFRFAYPGGEKEGKVSVLILPRTRAKIESVEKIENEGKTYLVITVYVDVRADVALFVESPIVYNTTVSYVPNSDNRTVEFMIPLEEEGPVKFRVNIVVNGYVVKQLEYAEV